MARIFGDFKIPMCKGLWCRPCKFYCLLLCVVVSLVTTALLSQYFGFSDLVLWTNQTYKRNYTTIYTHPNYIELNESLSPRQTFTLWDNFQRPDFGPEAPAAADRYLIYRCDETSHSCCGGWDNRINGALLAYVMANLTGRRFKFEQLRPACDVTNYVVPNTVDWHLAKSFHRHIYWLNPQVQMIKKIDDGAFSASLPTTNFSQLMSPDTPYVYFMGNLRYELAVKCSTVYRQQMAWAADLDRGDVKAALFKHLFKLSGYLQDKLGRILREALPSPAHRLVCAHVRMGRNPSNPDDVEVRQNPENLGRVWDFLRNQSTSDLDRVFVTSDSASVVEASRGQDFADRLVNLSGPILHVDKMKQSSIESQCGALERLITEEHLLMMCDVLMVSNSGLSQLAAYIRGTDRGLYCLMLDGDIKPCHRRDLLEIYSNNTEKTCQDLHLPSS